MFFSETRTIWRCKPAHELETSQVVLGHYLCRGEVRGLPCHCIFPLPLLRQAASQEEQDKALVLHSIVAFAFNRLFILFFVTWKPEKDVELEASWKNEKAPGNQKLVTIVASYAMTGGGDRQKHLKLKLEPVSLLKWPWLQRFNVVVEMKTKATAEGSSDDWSQIGVDLYSKINDTYGMYKKEGTRPTPRTVRIYSRNIRIYSQKSSSLTLHLNISTPEYCVLSTVNSTSQYIR